jgi:uncharacterized protein (DUF1501 family)
MQSRREFLKTAAVGVSALFVPPALLRARPARADGPEPVLVVLYLRGAADALNLVVPYADPRYYEVRPTLAVPAGSVLNLDGFFGLHPALAPLLPHYQSGRLAMVHACGSPDATRSHFDAQDYMEYGAPGDRTIRQGWLNRYALAAGFGSPLAAVTMGARPVKALEGTAATLSINSLAGFKLDYAYAAERRAAIEDIYAQGGGALAEVADSTFSVLDAVTAVNRSTSVTYPAGAFAEALKDVAALVKAQIGLRVAAVDYGGWDHHVNEDTAFPTQATALAGGLGAFASDLGSQIDRTCVLIMTEFGRRLEENGGRGTDHGHGFVLFGLGGGVAGGRVLLANDEWPGLMPEDLDNGDLAVTTDFRDAFSEILHRHMGLANLSTIFPGFTPDPSRYPGLFA